MSPEERAQQLLDYTAFLAQTALERGAVADTGDLYNNLAAHYRALGIEALLLAANRDAFFHALIQSGITRRYYLEQCQTEGCLDDSGRRASAVAPFLDAVAADQLSLARRIGQLSATAWMREDEYEDDFAYARFLYAIIDVPQGQSAAECVAILQQYADALQGQSDPRFDVCTALSNTDPEGFADAFDELIAATEQPLPSPEEGDADAMIEGDLLFEPNRQVFVEGLALLRIADLRGIPTRPEYPRCPVSARDYDYEPFSAISFPDVPL